MPRMYQVPRAMPVKPARIDTGFTSRVPIDLRKAVGYVDAVLYDCTSPISSATTDTLFQVPIGGQLSGSATVKKTLLHTNIKQGGQLPADERFEVHGYGMWLTPLGLTGSDAATTITLTNAMLNGWVTIKFRGYRDLDYSIISLLSGQDPSVVAPSSGVYWIQWASPHFETKGFKPLSKPIILSRSVPIEVNITWGAAPNAGSTNTTILYFGLFGIKEFAVVS